LNETWVVTRDCIECILFFVNVLAFKHFHFHHPEINGFLVKCLKNGQWLSQAQDIFHSVTQNTSVIHICFFFSNLLQVAKLTLSREFD